MKNSIRWALGLVPVLLLGMSGCATPAAPVSADTDRRAEITLQDGDVVKVSFPGAPNLDLPAQPIRRDGKIAVPLAGDVTAAGSTPTQLQQQILTMLSSQLVTKEVVVTVVSSTYTIYVDGPVQHPGKVILNHPITLLEAIEEAGGFDYSKANISKIVVIRHGTQGQGDTSFNLDLKPVLKGKQKDSFFLAPGDIVHIPEKFNWF